MPEQSPQFHTLQSLLWPEQGLCTERDLYMRLSGPCGMSMSKREIQFSSGGQAKFDSYNNIFNCGKWHKHCDLDRLWLTLRGTGRFELVVFYAQPEQSWERQVSEIITLDPAAPLSIDLRPAAGFSNRGLLFFELRALSEAVLSSADWQTDQPPRQMLDLMLSITTFKREAAVARTVARFSDYIETSPLKGQIHLSVVDNGRSAEITPSEHVTLIGNENLGGSGGFARGYLEAQRRGADYCLFMDDDASVHMDSIARTWTFLAYSTDPDLAIAGAVSNAQHRWQLWENGALFNGVCQPQHMGLDLRDISQVALLEFDSTATQPGNFYGGWWYFAFPVARVQHMPFPFFVRGDDVSFSLVHPFEITTLPGVISFQDEDFSVKETPLTVYLDLRSHLAHHLSLPQMDIGRKGIARIIMRFYMRSLLMCHYETMDAMDLALRDVSTGPDFFAQNADMSLRRTEIGALTKNERWQPHADTAAKPQRRLLPPNNFAARLLMKLTLNGHLLPFFKRFGNRVTLPAALRGARRPIWGAAEITYQSVDGKRSYTVKHSKRRAAALTWAMLRHLMAMMRNYDELRDQWQAGYNRYTQEDFWRDILKMDTSDPAPKSDE